MIANIGNIYRQDRLLARLSSQSHIHLKGREAGGWIREQFSDKQVANWLKPRTEMLKQERSARKSFSGNSMLSQAGGESERIIRTRQNSKPFPRQETVGQVHFHLFSPLYYRLKFLKCDWLRPVVFNPNLKYLHVKITASHVLLLSQSTARD